jgi:hypothetical protein
MKIGITAVIATSTLTSLGLAISFPPVAHAATPGRTTTVHSLSRSTANFHLGSTGTSQATGVRRATTSGQAGAATFVDNYPDLAVVDLTLSQSGVTLGSPVPLEPEEDTAPQTIPAGSYTLTVTDAEDGSTVTSGTFSVTAGADSSEVLYPSGSGTSVGPALTQFVDQVTSTPGGQSILSVRNTSSTAGPVDVYINGTKVIADLAEGGHVDLTEPVGNVGVQVVQAGAPAGGSTTQPVLASASVASVADTYAPLYIVDDPDDPANPAGVELYDSVFELGYRFAGADGGVFDYGSYPFLGSTGGKKLNQPVVGGADSPDDPSAGYYLVASDGGVFNFGGIGAPFEGSTGGMQLNAPVVGMATTFNGDVPDPQAGVSAVGYLLVAADGGVFAYNTPFYGSLGGTRLSSPVVGISSDPTTGGYTLVQADGSLTTFGPGITPHTDPPIAPLNAPVVGIAPTPDDGGFWLVAADGGVFNTGDAQFFGSAGDLRLNQPIVGISPNFDGEGYSLIARDGGVFTFGDSAFYGSTGNLKLNEPIVGSIN